jgi:hypothetical protein
MNKIGNGIAEDIRGRISRLEEAVSDTLVNARRRRCVKRREKAKRLAVAKYLLYGNLKIGDVKLVRLWEHLGMVEEGMSCPSEGTMNLMYPPRVMRRELGDWTLEKVGMDSPIKGITPGFFRGLELGGAISRRKGSNVWEMRWIRGYTGLIRQGLINGLLALDGDVSSDIPVEMRGYKFDKDKVSVKRKNGISINSINSINPSDVDDYIDGKDIGMITIGRNRSRRMVWLGGGVIGMGIGDVSSDNIGMMAGVMASGRMVESGGEWGVWIYAHDVVKRQRLMDEFKEWGIGYKVVRGGWGRIGLMVSPFWLALLSLEMVDGLEGVIMSLPGVHGGRGGRRGKWRGMDLPLLSIWWWDKVYGGSGYRGIKSGLVPFCPGRQTLWLRLGGRFLPGLHLEGVRRGWGVGSEVVNWLLLTWGERYGRLGDKRW